MKAIMARRSIRSAAFLAALASAVAATPCAAQIVGICTLLVTSGGTLAPNTAYTQLSSANSGGSPGTVNATVIGAAMTLQLTGPSNFTSAPSGGNSNVSFATQYSATGATVIASTGSLAPRTIALGLTFLSINLTATKSSGIFPAGSYAADVTVSCS